MLAFVATYPNIHSGKLNECLSLMHPCPAPPGYADKDFFTRSARVIYSEDV